MPSWAGTGIVMICMLTLCRRSAIGVMRVSPGPRVVSRSCPKRSTTPRSNWVMTRTLDPASSRTTAATTISTHMMTISSPSGACSGVSRSSRNVGSWSPADAAGSGRSGVRFLGIGTLRAPPDRAEHSGQDDAGESGGGKPGEQQNSTEQHHDRNCDLVVRSARSGGLPAKLIVQQSGELGVLGLELTLHFQ